MALSHYRVFGNSKWKGKSQDVCWFYLMKRMVERSLEIHRILKENFNIKPKRTETVQNIKRTWHFQIAPGSFSIGNVKNFFWERKDDVAQRNKSKDGQRIIPGQEDQILAKNWRWVSSLTSELLWGSVHCIHPTFPI